MQSEKTRVALVGCGGMGRSHLNVLKELPDFEVVALCDIAPESLNRATEIIPTANRYGECQAMCDAERPDLVVVATQTRGHHAPTVTALNRGISVLCEKPIAIDLIEADEMVDAAAKSGAKLAIHQQNHLHPGIRKALKLVEAGEIGEVMTVRGRNKAGRKSGNEFMEMGTHVADMMLRFGGRPEWCAGTVFYEKRLAEPKDIMEAKQMSPGDRDSGRVMGARAVAHYGFPGGAFGELHFTDYSRGMSANYGVDVLGTEGQLAVRTGGGNVGQSLWHLPRPMEGTPDQLADWKPVDLSDVGIENPVVTMYRHMAEAIRADSKPPCDGETGRAAFEMIMAIYQSHKEGGRRVALPLTDRRHPLESDWASPGN